MYVSHIIWGDHPETGALIEELRKHDSDIITVVVDGEYDMERRGDIVYASKKYIEDARDRDIQEVHYRYIPEGRRMDGVAWRVMGLPVLADSEVSGELEGPRFH